MCVYIYIHTCVSCIAEAQLLDSRSDAYALLPMILCSGGLKVEMMNMTMTMTRKR